MPYPIIELLIVLLEKICVIVVIAYLITRTRYFREVLEKRFTLKNRAILILIFGAVSIFGTYSGIEIFGAIANVRDLGPMVAGLIGGPVIGLGAGLIGGIHRYFLHGFTCVPCSLATVLAGLFGGIIYILKRGKFIGVPGAVLFAALMETFHMGLLLILARPYTEAVKVVEELSIPMIFANSLGMLFFTYIISNRIRERETVEERDKYFAELERKRYELKLAHDIQQSFLPDAIPGLPGFGLAALNIPAKEVGGDFYDFIPISESKIGLTIADVSGKGVPAALFMALSRTIVRAKATQSSGVREVIQAANSLIEADAKSGMFVTLFYAVLDVSARTLTYVSAGHNPPLILKAKTKTIMRLDAKGIALGAIEDIELEERRILLDGGDIVVFYTDGVTEAINKKKVQFGEDRLIMTIKANYELSANDMIMKIKGDVLTFCGDEPQFDDITLMALKAE